MEFKHHFHCYDLKAISEISWVTEEISWHPSQLFNLKIQLEFCKKSKEDQLIADKNVHIVNYRKLL